jgi:hypothetical protein
VHQDDVAGDTLRSLSADQSPNMLMLAGRPKRKFWSKRGGRVNTVSKPGAKKEIPIEV